jgi:hypothetical protein
VLDIAIGYMDDRACEELNNISRDECHAVVFPLKENASSAGVTLYQSRAALRNEV